MLMLATAMLTVIKIATTSQHNNDYTDSNDHDKCVILSLSTMI